MSCNEWKETELGLIPSEWEYCQLRDKVDVVMGQSPKSEYYNTIGEGIPFLQGRKTFGYKYPLIDTWCNNPIKIAQKGDILLSVRAPVGDLNIANTDICIGRGLASLRMKNNNNEFLYYLLLSYKKNIINKQTGTVFGAISKLDIECLKLPFPPLHEQKAIAKILSDIDEKIEINNRINKVLEEIAQTIFKHWFVNFEFPNENGEPYKSSGGEMVDSELGPIPKGWEVKRLGDLITRNKEKFKHKKQWYMLDIIDLSVMPRFSISISEFSRGYNFDTNIYKLNEYDILFGSIRPYFGKAGFSPINGGVAGTVYSFQPIDKSNYSFILFLISSRGFIDYSISMSRGTKMPVVSFEDIGNYLVPYNEKTIKKFNDMTIDFIKIIKTNIIKNKLLASIRDTLLPKLMSGEIRVPLDEFK